MRRMIGVQEVEDIALGAAVLGTGGGGDPYIGKLMATEAIRQHGPVELVTVDEVGDDEMSVSIAMMGAPTVMVEKMPSGQECVHAFMMLDGSSLPLYSFRRQYWVVDAASHFRAARMSCTISSTLAKSSGLF